MTVLVIVGYVPLAMVVASYAGRWASQNGARAEHPRQVTAVVLAAAEATKLVSAVWVPARWGIGSRARTGSVPVPDGTPAGAVVRVWIDRSGHVAMPPLTAAELRDQVRTVQVVMPVLTAEFLALSLCALRWYLNRRRLARWDSDWWSIDQRTGR